MLSKTIINGCPVCGAPVPPRPWQPALQPEHGRLVRCVSQSAQLRTDNPPERRFCHPGHLGFGSCSAVAAAQCAQQPPMLPQRGGYPGPRLRLASTSGWQCSRPFGIPGGRSAPLRSGTPFLRSRWPAPGNHSSRLNAVGTPTTIHVTYTCHPTACSRAGDLAVPLPARARAPPLTQQLPASHPPHCGHGSWSWFPAQR